MCSECLGLRHPETSKKTSSDLSAGNMVSNIHTASPEPTTLLIITIITDHSFSLPTHPLPQPHVGAHLILVCRTESQRHTVPLIPGTGHADMMQIVTHFLHNFVILVSVRIYGEAKFV